MSRLNASDIKSFVDEAIKDLVEIQEGCSEYKLDDDLSLFVGWTGGYDPNDTDDGHIHSTTQPEFVLEAGIKGNHEYMKTDYDWLNFPYDPESGEVCDTSVAIGPEGITESDAQWIIDQYEEVREMLDSGEAILESKKVTESKEEYSFQEIEARMDNAEDYSELYEAASLIANTDLRVDVENLIGQCEDDGDSIEECVSVVTSDLIDMYINDENVENLKENKKVESKKVTESLEGVPEEAYDIASEILGVIDDRLAYDEFTTLLDKYKKEFSVDYDDLEADVRGILSYEGVDTDFETGDLIKESKKLTEGEDLDQDTWNLIDVMYNDIMEAGVVESDGTYDRYEILDLEDYQDWYDSELTAETYNKAVNKVNEIVSNARYYKDSEGSGLYIQLNDNHTLWNINYPEGMDEDEADKIMSEEYSMLVNAAAEDFEEETGTPLYLLGRSGRHACVKNNLDNAERYDDLKATQEKLEQRVVKQIEEILQAGPVDESKKIVEKSTREDYEDYCRDLKINPDKNSSVNKYINDYTKTQAEHYGVKDLTDKVNKVRKELRESIKKKVTESEDNSVKSALTNLNVSTFEELDEEIDRLLDEEIIDDDQYDDFKDISSDLSDKCLLYITKRAQVTNTDPDDEIAIESDYVTSAIKDMVESLN